MTIAHDLKATHTPTPWVRKQFGEAEEGLMETYGADGELVLGDASNWGYNQIDDEDHAFHCVNSHAGMLAALLKIAAGDFVNASTFAVEGDWHGFTNALQKIASDAYAKATTPPEKE